MNDNLTNELQTLQKLIEDAKKETLCTRIVPTSNEKSIQDEKNDILDTSFVPTGNELNMIRLLVKNQLQNVDDSIRKTLVIFLAGHLKQFTTQGLQTLLSRWSSVELLQICITRFNDINKDTCVAELIIDQTTQKPTQIILTKKQTVGGEDLKKMFPNLSNEQTV